jgi:hypothetical protein
MLVINNLSRAIGFVWVRSSRDPLFSTRIGFVPLNNPLCRAAFSAGPRELIASTNSPFNSSWASCFHRKGPGREKPLALATSTNLAVDSKGLLGFVPVVCSLPASEILQQACGATKASPRGTTRLAERVPSLRFGQQAELNEGGIKLPCSKTLHVFSLALIRSSNNGIHTDQRCMAESL